MNATEIVIPAARIKRLRLADHLVRRNSLLYVPVRRALEQFEALDESARRRWRAERLERVLDAARRTPYGRKFGCAGPLSQWPLLEKDAVRHRNSDFLTPTAWIGVSASTSGTSGMPLRVRRSLTSVVHEQVMHDRLLERAGVDAVNCRAAVMRGDDVKHPADRTPPFWKVSNGGRRLIFSSNHLDRGTVADFAGALREYRPDVLYAYPTVLESLCMLLLDAGLRLTIPVSVCGSEVLTRATIDLAREALRTRVIGYYGQAERVAWAQGDPTLGFRFDPTYSINELTFIESEPDADAYELIATGLWNLAMPLVRYRTGDRILLPKGADPLAVAEGREMFLRIPGRHGDYLVSPSGARIMDVEHFPHGLENVVRMQFIQESPESIRMLVVPKPQFGDADLRMLREHAALKLPPSMRLSIETTTRLERTPAGKAPVILRRI